MQTATDLSSGTLDSFARRVEALLKAWDFPESDRVHFEEKNHDLVIQGKRRGSQGKGQAPSRQRCVHDRPAMDFCAAEWDVKLPGVRVRRLSAACVPRAGGAGGRPARHRRAGQVLRIPGRHERAAGHRGREHDAAGRDRWSADDDVLQQEPSARTLRAVSGPGSGAKGRAREVRLPAGTRRARGPGRPGLRAGDAAEGQPGAVELRLRQGGPRGGEGAPEVSRHERRREDLGGVPDGLRVRGAGQGGRASRQPQAPRRDLEPGRTGPDLPAAEEQDPGRLPACDRLAGAHGARRTDRVRGRRAPASSRVHRPLQRARDERQRRGRRARMEMPSRASRDLSSAQQWSWWGLPPKRRSG